MDGGAKVFSSGNSYIGYEMDGWFLHGSDDGVHRWSEGDGGASGGWFVYMGLRQVYFATSWYFGPEYFFLTARYLLVPAW